MVKIFSFLTALLPLVTAMLVQPAWSQDFPHPLATVTPAPTGTLKLTNITGVSNFESGTAPTIYGGLAGDCGTGANDFCNTCTAGLIACNEVRIQKSLQVVITVESTDTTHTLRLVKEDSTTSIGNIVSAGTSSIVVTWEGLCTLAQITDCNVANGDATVPLTSAKEANFRVWKDLNDNNAADPDEFLTIRTVFVPVPATSDTTDGAEGVSKFETFPGDEKVYIDLADIPSIPNGSTVSAIRILFSDVNFDQAKIDTAFGIQDIPVTASTTGGDAEVGERFVDGLTNGEDYHFRIAVVDQAKNVFYWSSDAYIVAATTGGDASCNTAAAAGPSTWPNCKHACAPDPVFGLLTKDLNCFVATAAYGSSLEPRLKVFRKFRYLLLHHGWGKSFVDWYYRVGPKGALLIYDKPTVRYFVRGILWPAYGFALLTIRWGFAYAFGVSLLILLSFVAAFVKLRRRSVRAKI